MKTTKKPAQAAEKNQIANETELIGQNPQMETETDFENLPDGKDSETIGRVGIMVISTENNQIEISQQKNRTIEDVTAEAETVKAENEQLKKQLDKEIKLAKARAKCARMNEENLKLKKVEEIEKQLEEFETGREGQEATFELSNKAGQKFKTGNTYLVEAVIAALKLEIERKKEELSEILTELY